MKKIILLSIFILMGLLAYPQSQIENPGFEEWEDVGLPEPEPVNWSSIKTTTSQLNNNNAPIVWRRSEDAHSGNYSVKLENIYVALAGIVATGTTGAALADYQHALGLIVQGKIDTKTIISKRFKVEDVRDAFAYAMSGDGLKTLIEF